MKKPRGIIQKAFSSLEPTFRGTIWEYALTYKLHGKAYESMPIEQNGHFWIKSARHLTGPLLALNDAAVRTVFIIGATQALKTVAGDIWTIFVMVHAPRNMLVAFETDKKAKEFCDIRLMEVIKKHPSLSKQITEADRFDVTKTYIKLAGMDLLAVGLNDSNLSTFSWPYIRVSEAWQSLKTGMLKKLFRRADRFPDNCKILCESQAGYHGEDLHTEASAAHQVPLMWACPFCGGRQSWECLHEFGTMRPADFVALVANPPVKEPPKAGSYSGMKWKAEGSLDERASSATWECYHCGTQIEDTKNNRMTIMDSYEQEYRVKQDDGTWKTPKQVCFVFPREAMWDNTFESAVQSYLIAKDAEASGNMTLLENWYMSERAVFYSPKISQSKYQVVTGSAGDPKDLIPNESFRCLLVDCQKDIEASDKEGKDVTGNFWWIADAVDKQGNTFQLGRGYATSWEELFGKEGVKNRLRIPTRNVAIDGGYQFDAVKEKAAQYRTLEKSMTGGGKSVWATWKIMLGDDLRSYKWDDNSWRIYKIPQTYYVDIMENGKWLKVAVQVYRWSSFSVKNQLSLLRSGIPGKPKFVAIDVKQTTAITQAKEVGDFSYQSQMDSEILGLERGKMKWLPIHKQNHYRDCSCMGIVLKALKGLIGHVAADEVEEKKE